MMRRLRKTRRDVSESNAFRAKTANKTVYKQAVLNCPHSEMKLKQNSFKPVSKLFWNCFYSVSFRCEDNFTD